MSSDRPTAYRDEELGAALRELDVPEHAPGFHAELRRRLAEDAAGLAGALPPRRRAPGGRRLRVAAVAAVAAIVLVALGLPRTERTPEVAGPGVATAAEVKAQVRASLTSVQNLSGVVVSRGPGQGGERRWRFSLDARGDFRLAGPAEGELITYDARAGVARSAQRSASLGGNTLFYAERRGVAPGPPDQGPPTWILPSELGAFVRALLAAEDARVREVSHDGRPAWHVEVEVVPDAVVPELSGDRLELTVDRETALPVRVVERKDGASLRELRIEELAANGDLPPGTFRLELPPGAEVMRSDEGFRRVELGRVEGVVGYAPLVPAWTPEGYELAEVAVARETAPTGAAAGNPPSRMVVSLSYRRGLDRLLVTTRLARVAVEGEPEARWSDPLATGEGLLADAEPLVVARGALRGARAELVLVPRVIPHLWALTDELVITVAGDVGRDDLLRVAESLRSRG